MLDPTLLNHIPKKSGAYILDIHVQQDFNWTSRAGKTLYVPQGRYLYCGSAKGPGGLKARLSRHCKQDKKAHWHVDPLTIRFGVQALFYCEDQSECDLVAKLLVVNGSFIPFKGFGSSDCPTCPSHLVQLPAKPGLDALFNPAQVLGPRR